MIKLDKIELIVNDENKNKFGEVFTSIELISEILIDIDCWDDPNKNYYANEGNRYSSEVYHINDNDSIEYYIPTESINEYKQFSGEYVNEDTVYVEGDKIKNQKADSSIYGYYKIWINKLFHEIRNGKKIVVPISSNGKAKELP